MMTAVAIYGATAFAAGSPAGPASPSTANPVTAEAVKGMAWILLAAVLGMALAAAGAAVSQAITASAALQGIARQPEASGKIFVPMILAIVFIETLAIYTLVVALLLIFTNPLKGLLT
jgi:F-type H+-transporting ATPase subunit c